MAFWDDVAKNIGQVGQNVGRFFGIGGTGGTGNKQQKKKKQLQPGDPGYVAPTLSVQPNQQQNPNQTLQVKKPVNIFEDLNKNLMLGAKKLGVVPVVNNQSPQATKPQPAASLSGHDRAVQLSREGDALAKKKPNLVDATAHTLGNFGKTVVSGLQQVGGNVADKAVMGGAVLDDTASAIMGRSPAQRAKTAQEYENLRNVIKRGKTVTDESLNPNKDFKFTGNIGRDAADLTGRSLQTGLDATMFINPGRLAVEGGKKLAAKELGKFAARDAGFFGVGQGAATGAQVYANTGDPRKALEEGLKSGLISGVTQGGLDITGGVVGKSRLLEKVPFNKTLQQGSRVEVPRVNIPVKKDMPVDEALGDSLDIPVSVNTPQKPQGPIIREIGGDAQNVGQNSVNAIEVPAGRETPNREVFRPDPRIEGVTPTNTGNTGLFTRAEINNERAAIDGALANKQLTDAEHAIVSKELDTIRAVDDAPQGQKIEVKEVTGIPVVDQTIVPTGLPEVPGTVRATTQTSPMQVETQAAANMPVISSPVELPKEVQTVLDNPKQFNKRQVESARNQRKLARQMAKTQEDTADALSRIETASPLPRSEGDFAPTGEFKVGKKGNVSEVATREAEAKRGADTMARTSTDDLIRELGDKRRVTQEDSGRVLAAIDNLKKANPETYRGVREFRVLENMRLQGNSDAGRQLGLIAKVLRKSASSDELTGRWDNKIGRALDDPTKMGDTDLKAVQSANDSYTVTRDSARRAEEQYKATRSKADLESLKKALNAEEKADLAAKSVEVNTAKRVLKKSKASNVAKVLNDLEKEAELNMMDHVTASQLSGPATGSRNLFGTEVAGVENRVGANVRAKVIGKLFGENVGGYARSGARSGRKEGAEKFVDDAKRRANYAGRNPLKHAQNWATTINSAGESSLHSQTQSRLKAFYQNQLKDQGVSGERLANDAEFLRLTDPDDMGSVFMDSAMKSSGLSGIYQKTQKIESNLSKSLGDWLGKSLPPKAADTLARGVVRIGLGYPTATGNFVIQSGKRAGLGLPSAIESGVKLAKGDKQGAAFAMDRALKEGGSGAAALAVGSALAASGNISGFYPDDPDERQRWTDEGKNELSIKIGDAWYPIPQGFGMFGLPLIVGATLNESGPEGVEEMFTDRKKMFKLLPADQAYGALQVFAGDATTNQDKSFIASTIRSFIPVGSFLNQTAKGLDETVNDTTTKDFWRNVYDQVVSGIPGVNNMSGIPDKTSSTGEPLRNPNLPQVYSGAQTVEQPSGIENSKKVDQGTNDTLGKLDKYGLLDDPNMKGVLEGTGKEALVKAKSGKQLDESDIKALKKGLVKGVSSEGTDTAYLERGEYDTNLAVLQLKRDLMKEDKTTKPSSLKDIDKAITRGTIYKDNQIPYDLIDVYSNAQDGNSINLEEWRKMGDPEADEYDPDMYQKLFEVDDALTKAGVGYGKNGKPKYYAKVSKAKGGGSRLGRGAPGTASFSSEFGKLKAGTGAPNVQQYDSIDQKSGSVPIIRRTRPNIVHRITSSG